MREGSHEDYSFPGIASVASFTVNLENPLGVTAFGSLFQIGWAFAIGIAFAIITCAPTSGGHFNPAITICFAVWQGFPWKKVPYYIFSQIFGAFIAGMLLMGMYWPEISALKEATLAAGMPLVANGAPASILCTFPNPTQTNLGYLFMTEWFVDSFIVSYFSMYSILLESTSGSDSSLGHCYLGRSRSCQSIHLTGWCSIRHWVGICEYGLGVCWNFYLY